MKKIISLFLAVCIALPLLAQARREIVIPNLKGYVTLKCDFHIHTVFSDGLVWPTVRIDEAYFEGLDAISITDHIEYRPFIKEGDVVGSHNRSYEIALSAAKARDIILIKGSEITRSMPPGHSNAIFITNSDELDKPDYMDALRAAKTQNAFIFWNHPGWIRQAPDSAVWYPEHTKIFEQGMMHGIEVAQYGIYYPEAHRWALEKKLTMLGNTDTHAPIQEEIDYHFWKHRTMTFVFAKDRTAEGIRDALKERRTAVYNNECVIGEEKYLKELFENAVEMNVKRNGSTAHITFKNNSDLIFHLKNTRRDSGVGYVHQCTIEPHSVNTIVVNLRSENYSGNVIFSVANFLIGPNKGLRYTIKL